MLIEIPLAIMYFITIYFGVFWLLVLFDKPSKALHLRKNYRPFVTIAVPCYNEAEHIQETLQALCNLRYDHKLLEIIVVDDCSTDDSAQRIKEFTFPPSIHFRLLENSQNVGKGASVNRALAIAQGEIFVCLDADSFPPPETLEKMLPHFTHDRVGAVLPLMKPRFHKENWILRMQWVEYLANFFLKRVMGTMHCIHVTPGPFSCYRKDALVRLGGFDVGNLTEDQELALRLQKWNYEIIQLADPVVKTDCPNTVQGWYKQRNRWYKGTVFNLVRHRDLIFNSRYGELGVFHLPMVIMAGLLSIGFMGFVFYNHLIRPALQKLLDLWYVNFNVQLLAEKWFERFVWLDVNYLMLFFGIVMLFFSLLWVICAHRNAKESVMKEALTGTALFMIVYPFLLGIVWVGVVIDLLRGKKQRW